VLLITVCCVLINLAVDLLSYLADPRLSVDEGENDGDKASRAANLARPAAGYRAALLFLQRPQPLGSLQHRSAAA
jgi:hypothetical protein